MRKEWEIMKLGEVYDVRDGTHDSPKYEKKGFALITSKNLKNDVLNYDNVNYISEQDYININKRSKVDKGDVLFAMIGTIGNPVVIKGVPDFAIKNVALFKIPKEQDSYFLKYYLDSSIVIDKMSKDAKGATQKFVGLGYLRNFPIPIPPLSEQKRIVAILDEAFAAIAKAKANAEKNLQNAKELFESYLQNVFAKPGKEWEDKCLGDVAYTNGRIGWKGLTAKEYTKEGPLFLSVHSLNYGDYVDFRDAFHISQARYEESPEIMLRKDDILICKDGAGIGKLGIVPELPDITTINSSLLLIRCKEEVLTKYLYYNLLSPVFQRIVQSRLMGATTPHLYQRDIVTFPILLPKLSVQKGIIQKLELLSGETKKLETIYQQKLNDLEELKKGILQKAFGGELAVDTPKLYATEHSVSSVAEEPVTAYKRANTNELNEDEWLQLYFMVFNIAFHNNKQEEAYLAEVKMEKSCHFGENVIKQLQFNRNAIKAMNGPADFERLFKLHAFAEANDIFQYDKHASYKKYTEGESFLKYFSKASTVFRPFIKEVNALLKILLPLKTDPIDIYATTYGAWNNLLLLKKEVSLKTIAKEGRWHEKKKRFTDADFEDAIEFLKTNNLVPKGKGKLVKDKID